MIIRGWVAEIRSADGSMIERLDKYSNPLKPPQLGHVFASRAEAEAVAKFWTGWSRRVYRVKRKLKRAESEVNWTRPKTLPGWHP